MELTELLNQCKNEVPECIGIKIYFVDKNNYCIKYLDEEKVIKRTQKGKLSDKMDNPKRKAVIR